MTDLLAMWMEARAHDWQPLTARGHRSRVRFITADLGTVRLVDLGPLRIVAWLAQMRRRGVGQGAIRGRFSTFKVACSWGVSRRLLRSNPVANAAPRLAVVRRSISPEPEQVVALTPILATDHRHHGRGARPRPRVVRPPGVLDDLAIRHLVITRPTGVLASIARTTANPGLKDGRSCRRLWPPVSAPSQ